MQGPTVKEIGSEKKAPWYLSRAFVIGAILIVGPFALPFLWFSPKFKSGTKIGATIAIAILTYASFLLTPVLLDYVEKAISGTGIPR